MILKVRERKRGREGKSLSGTVCLFYLFWWFITHFILYFVLISASDKTSPIEEVYLYNIFINKQSISPISCIWRWVESVTHNKRMSICTRNLWHPPLWGLRRQPDKIIVFGPKLISAKYGGQFSPVGGSSWQQPDNALEIFTQVGHCLRFILLRFGLVSPSPSRSRSRSPSRYCAKWP